MTNTLLSLAAVVANIIAAPENCIIQPPNQLVCLLQQVSEYHRTRGCVYAKSIRWRHKAVSIHDILDL